MNKRIDAMYRMYLTEKEKHHETKVVLDKAIGLASQLLTEIHKLERSSTRSQSPPVLNANRISS
jgi:hypothetical protein